MDQDKEYFSDDYEEPAVLSNSSSKSFCDEDEEETDNEEPGVLSNDSSNQQKHPISTEGLTHEEISIYKISPNDCKKCNFCNKYYGHDMIVPIYDKDDEVQCWHCLFWMNYASEMRKTVDGTFGMTIADYIMKCKDVHEFENCIRNTDSGGCYLCEFNLGMIPTDIKNVEKLEGKVDFNDDLDDHIDIPHETPEQVVVYI